MQKHFYRFQVAVGLVLLSVVTATVAGDSTERVKEEVVGMWIVDVQGETRTRTLSIKSAELGQDGIWLLDSTYGWTDDVNHSAVSAKLIPKAHGYNLMVTTQASSVISAEYSNSNIINGTFVWKSGKVKPVKLERLSSDEVGKRAAIQRKNLIQSAIKSPAADVPASCAGFVGSWTGNWPSYGPKWLWVTEINANCVARYAVTVTSTFPDKFERRKSKGVCLLAQKPMRALSITNSMGKNCGLVMSRLPGDIATMPSIADYSQARNRWTAAQSMVIKQEFPLVS